MKNKKLAILLLLFVLFGAVVLVSAVPPPTSARCKITCTVAEIVEWSQESFPDIDLGELTVKNKQAAGEASLKLYINGDVTIIADNSGNAELTSGENTLHTEYKLGYDGSGINQTGGNLTEWSPFDTFIKDGAQIIHIPTDGAVEVVLSVKASIEEIRPENAGQYNAVQTLTVCWK
ncbi:MAG: hypothetical protein PHQ00_00510 [Phycisphaerae bacterium]|nr:hypothetical protein [Phycisphaerae bacterium]